MAPYQGENDAASSSEDSCDSFRKEWRSSDTLQEVEQKLEVFKRRADPLGVFWEREIRSLGRRAERLRGGGSGGGGEGGGSSSRDQHRARGEARAQERARLIREARDEREALRAVERLRVDAGVGEEDDDDDEDEKTVVDTAKTMKTQVKPAKTPAPKRAPAASKQQIPPKQKTASKKSAASTIKAPAKPRVDKRSFAAPIPCPLCGGSTTYSTQTTIESHCRNTDHGGPANRTCTLGCSSHQYTNEEASTWDKKQKHARHDGLANHVFREHVKKQGMKFVCEKCGNLCEHLQPCSVCEAAEQENEKKLHKDEASDDADVEDEA